MSQLLLGARRVIAGGIHDEDCYRPITRTARIWTYRMKTYFGDPLGVTRGVPHRTTSPTGSLPGLRQSWVPWQRARRRPLPGPYEPCGPRHVSIVPVGHRDNGRSRARRTPAWLAAHKTGNRGLSPGRACPPGTTHASEVPVSTRDKRAIGVPVTDVMIMHHRCQIGLVGKQVDLAGFQGLPYGMWYGSPAARPARAPGRPE
jgi:hypothetical protein